jgi:hypothetical protein
MSSGFLDLAYLIEISIVFNLAYREVNPLIVRRQIENKIQKITERKEVESTIKYCQNNSDKLAEGAVTNSYKKFTSTGDSLLKKIDESHWININMAIVLFILLFATTYQHLPPIKFVIDHFDGVWWSLFPTLVVSIIIPMFAVYNSNKKIKSIYQTLENNSEFFLDTYNKYLTEKAENKLW